MEHNDFDHFEWLHLYPQAWWHSDAHIVGTRGGLLALQSAIAAALAEEHGAFQAQVFAKDGEGYGVSVYVVPHSEMRRMAVPYTNETAKEQIAEAMWPWHLPRKPKPVPPGSDPEVGTGSRSEANDPVG